MYLTKEQLQIYEHEGFLFLPNCFSQAEIAVMKEELPSIFAEDSPRRVLEKESNIVRSVYGSHTTNEIAHRLSLHPRLVEPAMQILGSKVYVYQFKINAKAAFGGDVWEWHQDYVFWCKEDGMPTARVTNAVVFLDEVNEFNGPLIFIPGSHKENVIDTAAREDLPPAYANSPAWISNLTASLKYALGKNIIAPLVARSGIVAPKGPAGSVLFFHANLVHGSATNMSPFDRGIVLITFNSIENVPLPVEKPRPEFLASRDCRPVEALPDNVLLL
jgi:L-proline 4-hydroxylase